MQQLGETERGLKARDYILDSINDSCDLQSEELRILGIDNFGGILYVAHH